MKILGVIICGYSKPHRFVAPIKSYEVLDDGKAFIDEGKSGCHIVDIDDVIKYDPEDAIDTLGGYYCKIPHEKLDYVKG